MINGFPIAASSTQPQMLGFPHAEPADESRQDGTALSFLGILMQVVAGSNPQPALLQTDDQSTPQGENTQGESAPSAAFAAAQPARRATGAEAILQSLGGESSASGGSDLSLFPSLKGFLQPSAAAGTTAPDAANPTVLRMQGEERRDQPDPGMQELLGLMQPVTDGDQLALPLQPDTEGTTAAATPDPAMASRTLKGDVLEAAIAVTSEVRRATDEALPISPARDGARMVTAEGPKNIDPRVAFKQQPGLSSDATPNGHAALAADPTPESVVSLLRGLERSVPIQMPSRPAAAVKSAAPSSGENAAPAIAETAPGAPESQPAPQPGVVGNAGKTAAEKNQKDTSSETPRDRQSPAAPVERVTKSAEPAPPVSPVPDKPVTSAGAAQPATADARVPEKPQGEKAAPEASKTARRDEPVQPLRTAGGADGAVQAAQKGLHELHRGTIGGTVGAGQASTETSPALHAGSVIDQIAKSLASSVQSGSQEVRLELHPKELGSVTVKVMVEQNGVAAQIDVKDPGVKAVLENNLPQLREALQREHIEVNRVEIALASEGTPQESTRQWGGRQQNARNADAFDDEADGQESSRSLGYNTMELTM
jgi:flagellar hook-length control protein FliK